MHQILKPIKLQTDSVCMSLGGTWDASGWDFVMRVGPLPGLHCAQIIACLPTAESDLRFDATEEKYIYKYAHTCTISTPIDCMCMHAYVQFPLLADMHLVRKMGKVVRDVSLEEKQSATEFVCLSSQPEFLSCLSKENRETKRRQGEKEKSANAKCYAVCVMLCFVGRANESCREWELVRRRGFYQSANHQVLPKAFRNKGLEAGARLSFPSLGKHTARRHSDWWRNLSREAQSGNQSARARGDLKPNAISRTLRIRNCFSNWIYSSSSHYS
jgi:hypothetical protein